MNYFDYIREYLDKTPSLKCVPVKDKAPVISNWNTIDVSGEIIDNWEQDLSGQCNGFGFLAGQHNIGYADYDTDDVEIIHRIDEVLDISQVCTKKGKKGKTVFFRFDKNPAKNKYTYRLRTSDKSPVLEVNLSVGQTVLPPSIHPETGLPYKWISQSLLDIDIDDLPILDIEKLEHLGSVLVAPSLKEGLKNVPTSITGDGSGKWLTITSECSRLLHHGHDELSIARTLVGLDRRLFKGNQFFLSPKIGKCLIGSDDYENAILWVTEYKFNIMRQDKDLRDTLKSISITKESIDVTDHWGEMKPLIGRKNEVNFPEDLFPDAFKKYCFDLSKLSAIPPEAYLCALLTSFSACTQGRVIIHAKKEFVVRPSISSLIVAPSGSRKDSVFDWAREPIRKLINRDRDKYKTGSIEDEKIITEALIQLDKRFKKAVSDKNQQELDEIKIERKELQDELGAIKKIKSNFIFESGTQEKLYLIANENQHRGIFICSSEFVQMVGVMSKKGNEALQPFLLKLFNGSVSESFSHQTIGGTNVEIEKAYGCALSSIQNDVLANYFDMVASGNNNNGFIQRFFLIPIDPKIVRMIDDDTVLDTSRVDNLFALLFDLENEIHVTWESEEAKDAYFDYDVIIREKAKHDVSFIRSFRSKYSGQSVKLAWLFAQADAPKGVIVRSISKKYYLMAVKWLEWQSKILDVTYSNISYDIGVRHADIVLNALASFGGKVNSKNLSNQAKIHGTPFKNAIDILVDANYVKRSGDDIIKNPNL